MSTKVSLTEVYPDLYFFTFPQNLIYFLEISIWVDRGRRVTVSPTKPIKKKKEEKKNKKENKSSYIICITWKFALVFISVVSSSFQIG